MEDKQIKNSLDLIFLEENKKEILYQDLINKSKDEQYVSKFKMKNIKKFTDRYVAAAAVAVLFICAFSFYSVQSDIFAVSDNSTVVTRSTEDEAVAAITATGTFDMVIPNGDAYSKVAIEDYDYGFLELWEALEVVYGIDIELFTAQEKLGKLELFFDESLQEIIDEQGSSIAISIAQNYYSYFPGYSDINIYSDGTKVTEDGSTLYFSDYIIYDSLEIIS